MTAAVIPTWTLGDRIRKARAVAGMDQRHFADALGVKPGTLAGWEADNSKPRDLVGIARRIEHITDVPAFWLLGVDPLEQKSPRQLGRVDGGTRGINAEYVAHKPIGSDLKSRRSSGQSSRLLHRRGHGFGTAR